MKFFIDSANLEDIKKCVAWGIVDGVTTNPSLIAKEGFRIEEQIRKICDIVDGDISAEVVGLTHKEMVSEGKRLAAIHSNVVIKCPLTREGIIATNILAGEGYRVNVTLCFSTAQALIAAKAGAYIVSPFVGRLDDMGQDGIDLIRQIVQVYDNYGFRTQILAASLRTTNHVVDCALAGAHIGTMPLKVMDGLFTHILTEQGLEQFLADHRKAFREMPEAVSA